MLLVNAVRWNKQNRGFQMIGVLILLFVRWYELRLHVSMRSVGKSAFANCAPPFSAENLFKFCPLQS
jgi:hypothetical protein